MVSAKTYFQLTGLIFAIVGVLHVYRLLTSAPLVFGSWNVPMWISVVGIVLPWWLSYNAFKLAKKASRK